MTDTVYIPQEDSYLLARSVKKYARGKVLDMGCGSGIQGITALNNTKEVTFADINPEAIKYVKKQVKAKYIITDLYTNIKDKYDTIIFNPPYLPEDEYDKEVLITTGGKQGWELIETFLKESKKHLNIDGQILLLFSSLTDKRKVDEIIRNLNYTKNLLEKENLFMEQLYVYQLRVSNPNIIKGHRGIVEIKNDIVIKRSLTEHYNAAEEAKFLKILNKHGIGPRYIRHDKDSLTMEYIKGERILDYVKKANKKQVINIIKKILDQLYIMDKLKINKLELINPYKHIIVRNHEPILIDFERCIHTEKPKNVTQFIQFLCSGKVGLKINVEALQDIAKKYKDTYDKKYLEEIIKNIK
ncbi:MAG: HemK2/MTQ2 family protein methyltransferase [Candidatus Woesearchaeota archaeon]